MCFEVMDGGFACSSLLLGALDEFRFKAEWDSEGVNNSFKQFVYGLEYARLNWNDNSYNEHYFEKFAHIIVSSKPSSQKLEEKHLRRFGFTHLGTAYQSKNKEYSMKKKKLRGYYINMWHLTVKDFLKLLKEHKKTQKIGKVKIDNDW